MARSCYIIILIQSKGPGTSLPSPALSQKHVRNNFHTKHWCLTKFHFDSI